MKVHSALFNLRKTKTSSNVKGEMMMMFPEDCQHDLAAQDKF